jgi:hypothetical protein
MGCAKSTPARSALGPQEHLPLPPDTLPIGNLYPSPLATIKSSLGRDIAPQVKQVVVRSGSLVGSSCFEFSLGGSSHCGGPNGAVFCSFILDTKRHEYISAVYYRQAIPPVQLAGIQFQTNTGRKSKPAFMHTRFEDSTNGWQQDNAGHCRDFVYRATPGYQIVGYDVDSKLGPFRCPGIVGFREAPAHPDASPPVCVEGITPMPLKLDVCRCSSSDSLEAIDVQMVAELPARQRNC